MSFLHDLKIAARLLWRAPTLWITVALTLALGIGANAAIFSVVRGVLLRPLVNRDESRLIYIRQSAPGIAAENTTFSVPEINDVTANLKTLPQIGTFSSIAFTVVGLGDPREIQAGVVDGDFFEVMGLRPSLGRLLNAGDDGPKAAGAAVLTYRFWANTMHADPGIIGKTIRLDSGGLGSRSATVVGVLEPCTLYPVETELIANVVTSPHHLSATMVQGREHRMTEVFGRLAPGADLESARAELRTTYAAMTAAYPKVYTAADHFQISATRLHDQINSRANTILWILFAASGLLFVIACSNVANLILARNVRRESEMAVRAALGATPVAMRRALLAESLILCGSGAIAGFLIAAPMVNVLARYASRFSVRAADMTLDSSMVWIGVGLAFVAAIFLAFVPRLPSHESTAGATLSSSSVRVTSGSKSRLRAFAITQITASFLLLAGAGMLIRTLLLLEETKPGFQTAHVLAINLPVMSYQRTPDQISSFYEEVRRRVAVLPGVERDAASGSVPWRDVDWTGFTLQFTAEGLAHHDGQDDPRARSRAVSSGYFATLGIPMLEGRDFNDNDRTDPEPVAIISRSIAQKLFPGEEALNRHIEWTDPVIKFIPAFNPQPRRVIGIVADVDDYSIIPTPAMTVYEPTNGFFNGRLLVRTLNDPYLLVPAITRIVRDLSSEQPVERARTLDDIRAEVLTPNRLNAIVFGGFAALALLISIVGVAGVLAFSVSARTREFGIRIALGALPHKILTSVLMEGFVIGALGIAGGFLVGFGVWRLLGNFTQELQLPGPLPLIASAAVILAAAVVASAVPAARAARVDTIQALRSE
ncbi:MAG TPA: ADOP family duplicated permease [Candidatus Limnocylindrales bacterium]|nr:ADOP family duplicated permease [Candidatus Limnocylindrales bacterium]